MKKHVSKSGTKHPYSAAKKAIEKTVKSNAVDNKKYRSNEYKQLGRPADYRKGKGLSPRKVAMVKGKQGKSKKFGGY